MKTKHVSELYQKTLIFKDKGRHILFAFLFSSDVDALSASLTPTHHAEFERVRVPSRSDRPKAPIRDPERGMPRAVAQSTTSKISAVHPAPESAEVGQAQCCGLPKPRCLGPRGRAKV